MKTTPNRRSAAIGASAIFALITILALYYYARTPYIPGTVEIYTATRDVGGNGLYLAGILLFALLAGAASFAAGMAASEIMDPEED